MCNTATQNLDNQLRTYRRLIAVFLFALSTVQPIQAAEEEAPDIGPPTSDMTGQRCLSSRPIRKTEVLDDQNILFYLRGAAIYLNHLPKPCKRLAQEGRFMYRTTVARICRYDIINLLIDSGGTLGLGRASTVIGKRYIITLATCVLIPAVARRASPDRPGRVGRGLPTTLRCRNVLEVGLDALLNAGESKRGSGSLVVEILTAKAVQQVSFLFRGESHIRRP